MDDKLKKRLAGAGVVLVAGFALVSLLPQPGQAPPPADTQVVTIPLQADQVMSVEPPSSAQATPPSLQAPQNENATAQLSAAEMEAAAGGDDDAVPESAPPPAAASAAAVPATAKPAPVTAAAVPAAAAPVTNAPPAKPSVTAKPSGPAAPAAGAAVKMETAKVEAAGGSGGNWFVQIGGYADIGNARQSQKQVQGKNLSCIIAPVDTNKGTIYRVRAGPFKSREAAQAAQTRLAAAGFAGATLVAP